MNDSNAWLLERVNAAKPEGVRWTPREIATDLVAKLKAEEPAAFAEWLDQHAVDCVQQVLVDRHRHDRARLMSQSRASVFSKAAKAHGEGGEHALDPYGIVFTVDEAKGERMTLGEMTGKDCLTAAAPFHRRVTENAMQAAFLEAVGKKAERRKVKSVLTRDQLVSMMASIGMRDAA